MNVLRLAFAILLAGMPLAHAGVIAPIDSSSPSISTLTINPGDPAVDCPNAFSTVAITNNDAGTLHLSATPKVGCHLVINPSNLLTHPLYVDFNGVMARWRGLGGHNVPGVLLQQGKENATCEIYYTGVQWNDGDCSPYILIGSVPTGLDQGPNGETRFGCTSTVCTLLPYKGPGLMEVNLYTQRVLPSGITFALANATASTTNYFYLKGSDVPTISSLADCSGVACATVSSSTINAGDQGDIINWGIPCFTAADGFMRYVGVNGTTIKYPDVSSAGISSCGGYGRTLYMYASTNPPTATDIYGTPIESGGQGGTWVGTAVLNGSKVPTAVFSAYNGCDAITGALKSNGDGTCQQAASSDLSDAANVLTLTGSQSPQNKTFDNTNAATLKANNFSLQDNTDVSKQLKFDLSSIGTGLTRTITIPNNSFTMAGVANAQTLSNKTMDGGSNTFTNLPQSALPANATAQQSGSTNVAGPLSTSAFTMGGLAASITPSKSGKVLIVIAAEATTVSNVIAGNGISIQISYGTGSAPANAAALTGTQVGSIITYTAPSAPAAAADVSAPITAAAVVTGLTVGTPYWIDLAREAVGGVGYRLTNVNVSAVEL